MSHPRLYTTPKELTALKKRRNANYTNILNNLTSSADWCLEQTPRSSWIPPISPDPIHENLYDRFYAIMGDLAITEHLAFAYALTGKERYGQAARDWLLASCRVWQQEADGQVDGGKAYAVSRLLKGIAVGYDMVFDVLSIDQQVEIRDTLARIGGMYYEEYFTTPDKSGSEFHTHHAIVEFASLGVMALALLDDIPEARKWLQVAVEKFERHLLPLGLATDGAQTEGATFWASTMQYRLFFMDALQRVTGQDLFSPHASYMNAEPALAGIAAEHTTTYCACHESFALQPSYGQLDYCAPVLLGLAKVYGRPVYQRLALWDKTLGHLQKSRYITPNGEQMLFELGGYACVWFDPDAPEEPDEAVLSWHFPSVDEAYVRASWTPGDLLAGVRGTELVVHAGGRAILVGTAIRDTSRILSIDDRNGVAAIRCETGDETLEVELQRPNACYIRRLSSEPWHWICYGTPVEQHSALSWNKKTSLKVVSGTLTHYEPNGFQEELIVGNGLLRLKDAAPKAASCVTVQPDETDHIRLEIKNGTV